MSELLRRRRGPSLTDDLKQPQVAGHARHKHLLASVQNTIVANEQEVTVAEVTKGIYPDNAEEWCYFIKHPKCPVRRTFCEKQSKPLFIGKLRRIYGCSRLILHCIIDCFPRIV